ncbi:APC family permease [Pseudomonas luteola]|uniref:APC family permease n=1 Tax=Pseudomonas luteola TaxID=47886 RepID=UPI001238FDED|nr:MULTISPECIES: APC family permease [Pseudomonas]MBA1246214.1 APC family permease [Pseudomonas zeshuii]QEU26918.1 APC family permease [Pseudomonas luteola]
MKEVTDIKHQLKRNSVSGFGALAMSAAFMGPAVSVFFNIVPAAGAAGSAFPLSFIASMIAILFIANSVIQFSKKTKGASFAFTFASEGLGPKAGFLAGWILLFAYAMISPITYAGFGIMASEFLQRQFEIEISWVYFFLLIGFAVSALSYFGISHSTRATLIFLLLELIAILALYGSVIFSEGTKNTIEPFYLSSAKDGISSIGAGMIFGILSFVGFEAAANLGEETRNAHKTIPRAITLSVLTIGLFYIAGAYVADIAFSLDAKAISENQSPFDTIARSLWGNEFAWIITITALNSVFANALAGQTSIVRNLFSLGRARILPRNLGHTNSNGVPVNAIVFDYALSIVLGLGVGLWKGGWAVWTLLGGVMSIGLILVYGTVTLALPFFYLRKHRKDFSPIKHLISPCIGLVLLLLPLYSSLWPVPEFPYNLAPYAVIFWILIGLAYYQKRKSSDTQFVKTFGSVLQE